MSCRVACQLVAVACFATLVRAQLPSWVLTPGSTQVLSTASGDFTWSDVLEQYFNYLPARTNILASPLASAPEQACIADQPTTGLWMGGGESDALADCTLDPSIYQYAIFPIGTYVYFGQDNYGAFANPAAAEKLCAFAPLDTPADDEMTVAINGQVVYNKSASNGGPVETLATTGSSFTFTWDLRNSTPAGQIDASFLAAVAANYPDPAATAIQAVMPNAATLANPALAAPQGNGAQTYPDWWVFQTYAGMHVMAVDLAAAPSTFNLTSLDWNLNYNVTSRATADTCAMCGLCAGDCPFVGPDYPNNPPEFCEMLVAGSMPSNGSYTWTINILNGAEPLAAAG